MQQDSVRRGAYDVYALPFPLNFIHSSPVAVIALMLSSHPQKLLLDTGAVLDNSFRTFHDKSTVLVSHVFVSFAIICLLLMIKVCNIQYLPS